VQLSGWARSPGEVAAWCSRTEAPVPPEVIAWGAAPDVTALRCYAAAGFRRVSPDDKAAWYEHQPVATPGWPIPRPDRRTAASGGPDDPPAAITRAAAG
jgi:hypothetical protein